MLYKEFTDENMHRKYPLSSEASGIATDGRTLRDSFIVDLRIVVPSSNEDGYDSSFYLSSVSVASNTAYVTIARHTENNEEEDVAISAPISMDLTTGDDEESRTIDLYGVDSYASTTGKLIIGTCEDIKTMTGVLYFTLDGGKLIPTSIVQATGELTGISVNGKILTGDVTLEAGDNIELSVDSDTNTITISYTGAESDDIITNSATLLKAVVNKYGQPITSINGINPDSSGNFTITTADCTKLDATGSVLTLSNPCSQPCWTQSDLDGIYSRIGDLNSRYSTLQTSFTSIMTSLATMIARMADIVK